MMAILKKRCKVSCAKGQDSFLVNGTVMLTSCTVYLRFPSQAGSVSHSFVDVFRVGSLLTDHAEFMVRERKV